MELASPPSIAGKKGANRGKIPPRFLVRVWDILVLPAPTDRPAPYFLRRLRTTTFLRLGMFIMYKYLCYVNVLHVLCI